MDGPNFGHHSDVFEAGLPPQVQGSRNDLSTAITILQDNSFDLNFLAREEPGLFTKSYSKSKTSKKIERKGPGRRGN